jgi:predicted RNase H-like HicB family nuclease
MVKHFTLEYWLDETWYVGKLKEVPGVFSQGETLQELEENIQDAYRLMMAEEEEALPRTGIHTKELEIEF